MAIKGDVEIIGGVPVKDAYVRIEGVIITKVEDSWRMTYQLGVYKKAPMKESPEVRLPAPGMDQFQVTFDLLGSDNPIALAYEAFKEKNLVANSTDV